MANPEGYNGVKSNDFTVQLRVRSVMDWILQGYMHRDIVAQGIVKWKVDEKTIRNYVSRAKKEFHNARKGKIEERIDFYIATKMKLYNEMQHKSSPKGADVASRILDSMAKLEGVMIEKVDVKSDGKQINYGITSAELKELADALNSVA